MARTGVFRPCARKALLGSRRRSFARRGSILCETRAKLTPDALQAAGVSTRRHQGAGLIHGYFGMGEASEAARLEAQRARADFKAMLERGA
jgi:hypothetical protein